MNDEEYMRMALALAKRGEGRVAPNPMVGAVVVKDGRVIGQGFHEAYGQAHAERNALCSCTESPEHATVYVTLEPCCHYGKQPPCTDALLEARVARVVVGSHDPNPLVNGGGVRLLRAHGVEVTEHVLSEECDRLNEAFFYYIRTGLPFVTLKYAMTLDGKIATVTGASRWVTGEAARRHVHGQRAAASAIMVGVGTVLADDPLLTCRLENGRNPLRVVCDTHLRTPLSSQLVQTARDVPTVIAACRDETAFRPYQEAGCHLLRVPEKDGHADLGAILAALGEKKVMSLLLEGGASLAWSAAESGFVQKVQAYLAPKLFGGETAKTPLGGKGFSLPSEALRLTDMTVTPLGEDFLLEGRVTERVHRDH